MPKYHYSGIQTAIALPDQTEVQLIPHAEVELPAELPYVQRLVQKGLLTPVVEVPKSKSRKPEGDDK